MLAKITTADYMSKRLITFTENTEVLEAIKKMLINRIPNAPVLDDQGNLVGMFSEKDAMKVVLEAAFDRGRAGNVSEYMNKEAGFVDVDTSIVEVAEKLLKSAVRCFPVYDGSNLVGIISRTDVLRALSSLL
ncbi:MAG: CBS domain-containing protein [Gammaproteobacteria bacterium]